MKTKDKLYETKNELDKVGNDINKKTKHIDELKTIQKEFNYQNTEVIELKSKLKIKMLTH